MPAVFVHGVFQRGTYWDDVRRRLDRHDHIAVDLPGLAGPAPAGFGCTMDECAAWLVAGLESLVAGAGPVDLVGHEWGGLLALRVAATRPDLLRSWATDAAALLDPGTPWYPVARTWQSPGAGEDLMAGILAMSQADVDASLVSIGVPADRTHLLHLRDAALHPAIFALYRSAISVARDWGEGLEAAGARPGLVLNAVDDHLLDAGGAARTAARTGATYLDLEGVGHYWALQQPATAAAALERFWNEV